MNNPTRTETELRAELNAARATIARLEAALENRPAPAAPTLTAAFAEALANSLPCILYLLDSRATLLWSNRHFELATGYGAEELVGTSLASFVAPESLAHLNQRFQAVFQSGSADMEVSLVLKDGRQVAYHLTGHRVDFAGSPCMIGIGVDIT